MRNWVVASINCAVLFISLLAISGILPAALRWSSRYQSVHSVKFTAVLQPSSMSICSCCCCSSSCCCCCCCCCSCWWWWWIPNTLLPRLPPATPATPCYSCSSCTSSTHLTTFSLSHHHNNQPRSFTMARINIFYRLSTAWETLMWSCSARRETESWVEVLTQTCRLPLTLRHKIWWVEFTFA